MSKQGSDLGQAKVERLDKCKKTILANVKKRGEDWVAAFFEINAFLRTVTVSDSDTNLLKKLEKFISQVDSQSREYPDYFLSVWFRVIENQMTAQPDLFSLIRDYYLEAIFYCYGFNYNEPDFLEQVHYRVNEILTKIKMAGKLQAKCHQFHQLLSDYLQSIDCEVGDKKVYEALSALQLRIDEKPKDRNDFSMIQMTFTAWASDCGRDQDLADALFQTARFDGRVPKHALFIKQLAQLFGMTCTLKVRKGSHQVVVSQKSTSKLPRSEAGLFRSPPKKEKQAVALPLIPQSKRRKQVVSEAMYVVPRY